MRPYFIVSIITIAATCSSLAEQAASNASPTDTAAATGEPSPAQPGQAPDAVMKTLSDLFHAGRYTEAQQLDSGLLIAYPGDQRLIKAKALLEKAIAVPVNTQPAISVVQPATTAPAVTLTGMDRVEYNSLIKLGREAQQTTDLEKQKVLLKQFMDDSSAFLQKHPEQTLFWQLRATSALSLDDIAAGFEAGQKLLAVGAADSNDPNLQQLMAQLKNKGWLDKDAAKAQQKQKSDEMKIGWLLGTWSVTRTALGESRAGESEEFIRSGSFIYGYEIASDGVRIDHSDIRCTVPDSGEIEWEFYLPPSEPEGVFVLRMNIIGGLRDGRKPGFGGKQFYPSGWTPGNVRIVAHIS